VVYGFRILPHSPGRFALFMPHADSWLARLARLKVDRARGDPAPHKPLLMLVVLELAEQGLLSDAQLILTPELAFRFCTYASIVAHRRSQRPDIRYPFYHLASDGVWTPLTAEGRPAKERREARFARLDPELFSLAQDPVWREQARRVLIAAYFPDDERLALYAMLGMDRPSDAEVARDAVYPDPEAAARQGREARFRINVVSAYGYTCALTRYRVTTIAGSSIVDAAHIHEFASSRNNDPRNGLALSKNAHWLFDQGLWSLSDDYRVLVAAEAFAEAGPEPALLGPYDGQSIHLPSDQRLWPDPRHLAWHRRNRFQGA